MSIRMKAANKKAVSSWGKKGSRKLKPEEDFKFKNKNAKNYTSTVLIIMGLFLSLILGLIFFKK